MIFCHNNYDGNQILGAVVDLVVDGGGEDDDDDDGDDGDNEHDNIDFAVPPCACAGS